ncbi:MAG: T9SS type A sorting domain-containing protein [Flavipsychrobacter sp.]|nr:T9SS type A sorting domain-containing protein [Flavipsychrobacter sp.]
MKRILFTLLSLPALTCAQDRNMPRRLHYPSTDTIRQITITNALGQTIFSRVYKQEEVEVNIKDYPKGFYFIRINGTSPWNYLNSDFIHFFVAHRPIGPWGIL